MFSHEVFRYAQHTPDFGNGWSPLLQSAEVPTIPPASLGRPSHPELSG